MATKERGFSLLELVIYVAILALMVMLIVQIVVSVVRSQRNLSAAASIENSAALSLDRMVRETRTATDVKTASSTLTTSPGKLVLDSTDASGTAKTLEFSLASGRLQLKENGSFSGYLTATGTSVTSLIFRRFATSTEEGIRVELTLAAGTSTWYRAESFYASAMIR